MKDIIITSGGENISPNDIENKIKKYDKKNIIDHIIIVGDKKKFLSALITLNNYNNFNNDIKHVNKYVKQCINIVNNKAFSNVHTIKKWKILPLFRKECPN